MTGHAKGSFDVKLSPEPTSKAVEGALGRMSVDKQYHGDLEGSGKGEMLSATTPVKGSAVYVALEQFTGTVGGRRGSFVLAHQGTMTRGAPNLVITVVPDSATGDLVGLSGRMAIEITEGKHLYDFEYSLNGSR